MAKGSSFQEHLKIELLDPEFAASYLAAALEEGDEKFLYEALAEIVKIHGVSKISSETGIARQALYKMLSSEGNPSFKNVAKLLAAVGLEISIQPKQVG
ncbi:addiction module antidote protein [Bdellovibrio bacteriovorus]|uniref:addiction module antidote protein n=1 Tax=Bdellovibrio TaxID=958 RepID=UPI0035A840E4